MNKKFIFSILCLILVFSLVSTSALAEESAAKPKDPAEFKYPVPEGLPAVDIASWEFRLVNQCNSIGRYNVDSVVGIESQGCDSRISDELYAMISDCRRAGNTIYVNAGYRNWEWQILWWEGVIKYQFDGSSFEAAKHIPAATCNEHQLGLGIDFTADLSYASRYDFTYSEDDVNSETYSWLLEHCAEYGFILRYPEGKEEYYGVACPCPMHFRYVGREAAEYIMDKGICLEEFLLLYGYPVKLPAKS